MSYDTDVANATSGRGEPDWDKTIKLCNRIRDSIGTLSMAQAMGSVMRRVKHTDTNVQMHALTLLESCVGNCGPDFQLELTKSTFHSDVKAILKGPYTDPRVAQRLKELLSSWANEFKNNSKMNPLIKFIEQLRREGVTFQGAQPPASVVTATRPQPTSGPPASHEDSDLKKAIQLSLLESKTTPPSSSPSLYPTVGTTPAPAAQRQPQKKVAKRRVRAIYDFVAAEDNELSFRAGEILSVLDDSDENWWRGETQLGKGLFPASFVSSNLSVEPQPSAVERKENQGGEAQKTKGKKTKGGDPKKLVMNEQKIDILLDMIKGADVTSDENKAENDTLLELEGECKKMKPVVEETISTLQRQEDEMLEINKKFEEALALYRKLLSEGPRLSSSALPQKQPSSVTPQPQPGLSEPTHYPTPHSQAHTLPLSQAQPPPYTANGVATNTAMFAPHVSQTQSGYAPELSVQPSTLQQPSSLGYGGLTTGTTPQQQEPLSIHTAAKQPHFQQRYYAQQPESFQPQVSLQTRLSSTPGAPQSVPTHYQPSFYPQQQQTRIVPQPLL